MCTLARGRLDERVFNPYAAVPSMHVAFALMIAWPLARLARRRVLGLLWLLYPLLITFVIVVTANHFIVDAFLGALTAGARHTARAGSHARGPAPGASRDRPRAHHGELLDGGAGPDAPTEQAPPRRERRAGERRRRERPRAVIAAQRRELVRNRLIESRLTPNAISLTGLALNLLAAVLVWEGLMFLGGVAFIVGSVMDTLDGRYSRMSGKGTPFGAFLDSTLDRIEEGIVLTAVAGYFALHGDRVAAAAVVVAVLASLMVSYTRARAEALGRRVQGGHRHPAGARGDPVDRAGVRARRVARAASGCSSRPCTCSRRSA